MTTSNTQSHTPGPYVYERDRFGRDDIWRIVAQPTQQTIGYLTFWFGDGTPEDLATLEANARLLAAAPDMFYALQLLVAALNRLNVTVNDGPLFHAFRTARHALAVADERLAYRAR